VNLSGGNQQKVSIAKWLHADARLLIFDEPGQGVDIGAKEHILKEIQRLAEEGRTVVMISSELEELAQIANRVLVMRAGQIAAELERDELSEHRVLELSVGAGSRPLAG
jgi:ribose transport system ATP-binding protein